MTDELTRGQKIAAGILIDVTELVRPVGVMWPMAISEGVERWIFETLPPGFVPPAGLEKRKLEILDAAVAACFHGIAVDAIRNLQDVAAKAPEARSFEWDYTVTWKDGEKRRLRLAIEPDDNDNPSFTLSLPNEWA